MYSEDILNKVSVEVLKKIQGEFGIEVRLSRGHTGEVWSENLSYIVDLLKGSVKKLLVCLKDNTIAEVYVLERDEHRLVIRIAPTDKKLDSSRLVFELKHLVEKESSYNNELLCKLSIRIIKDIKQTVETGTLSYENININSGITRLPFTKETVVNLLSHTSLKVVVNVISDSLVRSSTWCITFTKKEDHLLMKLQRTFNTKVHEFSYALANYVTIINETSETNEQFNTMLKLIRPYETDSLTSVNIPSNRYPKEKNVIKQEQGLPFDLEQLCNKVSNTCGSVHSLKETISAITQNQELTVQLERQKKRFLLEVTGDIVSNWNAAVEFRFSPDLPVESLFLHFPERSVDMNRHVVTFLNNCKLKYIHKTDVKEEHYLLSVELDDKTYNTGIPVNAVDFITVLSAFGGRVEISTLLNHFRK